MADQTQALCLQLIGTCPAQKLSQPFRTVHEEQIPAVFESPGGAFQKVLQGAAVLPPGKQEPGRRTAGKIGGIADAAGKAAGGNPLRYLPQIGTYTFQTGVKTVAADVFQGRQVGTF